MAAESGHLDLIAYLHTFMKTLASDESSSNNANSQIRVQLDIQGKDHLTGENAVLMACKMGHFSVLKYLHEQAGVDVHSLNFRNETAVFLAALGSRKLKHMPFLQIIMYLNEVCGVDILYNYEETLLVCDDKKIINYLERYLKSKGILISKTRIDYENRIKKNSEQQNQTKPIYGILNKEPLEFCKLLSEEHFYSVTPTEQSKLNLLLEAGVSSIHAASKSQKSFTEISCSVFS